MRYEVVVGAGEVVDLTPVRVDQRWDRYTRSWVTTLETAEGYQVGDAAYDGTRADAAASKAQYERMLSEPPTR